LASKPAVLSWAGLDYEEMKKKKGMGKRTRSLIA